MAVSKASELEYREEVDVLGFSSHFFFYWSLRTIVKRHPPTHQVETLHSIWAKRPSGDIFLYYLWISLLNIFFVHLNILFFTYKDNWERKNSDVNYLNLTLK